MRKETTNERNSFKLCVQSERQKTFYFTKQIYNINSSSSNSSSRMFRNIACFHNKNNGVSSIG